MSYNNRYTLVRLHVISLGFLEAGSIHLWPRRYLGSCHRRENPTLVRLSICELPTLMSI